MQLYADIYLSLTYSNCFGRPSRPSSGIRKTVVAACGTNRTIWGANFLKRDQIRTPKKSNEMQLYADIYLLLNYSICFGLPSRPSSGVRKTVVAACGTDHTIWGASFLKRDQIRTPKKSNKMQLYADIYLLLITLTVSGVHRAHHQEYVKL